MNLTLKPNSPPHIEVLIKRLQRIYLDSNKLLFKCERFKLAIQQEEHNDSFFEIFEYIESWDDKKFFAPNQGLNIQPKHIAHVQFMNLKELKLSHNNIASIEAISWLNAPSLQLIFLSENQITSLKPLVKCVFKNLVFLNYEQNPTNKNQFAHLTRLSIKSQIQRLLTNDDINCCRDISETWLSPAVKLPIKEISILSVGVDTDVNQRLYDKFEDRFMIKIMKIGDPDFLSPY